MRFNNVLIPLKLRDSGRFVFTWLSTKLSCLMEASQSLSLRFPLTYKLSDTIQCSRRAHMMQHQLREKEEQLRDQLVHISQRQHEAHKRNQELLLEFKKIEDKLSHLSARSDNFRIKQEIFRKQMCTFLSKESKCVEPDSEKGPSYIKKLNTLSGITDHSIGEQCNFLTSGGHSVQPSANFSLCPTQHLILQGCCSHLSCCMAKLYWNDQFGSSIPDKCKTVFNCTSESQKENLKPDTKEGRLNHCSELVADGNSPKSRTMPLRDDRETLQCKCSCNTYAELGVKFLDQTRQNIIKKANPNDSVMVTNKKEDSFKIAVYQTPIPNSVSENTQLSGARSSVSVARGDKKFNKAIDQKNKTEQTLCKRLIVNAKSSVKNHDHVKNSASNSLVGFEVSENVNMYKTVKKSDKYKTAIQSVEEMKNTASLSEESMDEQAVGYHKPKHVCTAVSSIQRKGTGLAVHIIRQSSQELSDEEHVFLKESKLICAEKQLSEDEHCKEETSISSDSSVEGKESMACSSSNSESEKAIEFKQPSLHREIVSQDEGLYLSKECITNRDQIKEILDMDISEPESEPSKKRESQFLEIMGDSRNIAILEEGNKLAGPNSSENKIISDRKGSVVEHERHRKMLIAEKEINTSEENSESDDSDSGSHKTIGIVMVKGAEPEEEMSINEKNADEDTDSDEYSGEYKIRDSDDDDHHQGSHAMNGSVCEGSKEENTHSETSEASNITEQPVNKNQSNTGQGMTGGKEIFYKCDTSDKEKSLSDDLENSDDDIDSLEEEEKNTDSWGSKHEGNRSDVENKEKDKQMQNSDTDTDDILLKANQNPSAREGESIYHPETVVGELEIRSQDLTVVEEDLEKQRSIWCCCLKMFENCIKSDQQQALGKRCSEDGAMELLQMHPVELGSSLPAEPFQKTPDSPTSSINSKTASKSETGDSSKGNSDIENENKNPPWSDSEDDVHFSD